jgi:rRNA processing protein Krr1/Pno1
VTPKFKPGDVVRVISLGSYWERGRQCLGRLLEVKAWVDDRESYDTNDPVYLWPEDCLELVTPAVTVEQALKVLTDAGYTVTITQGKQ